MNAWMKVKRAQGKGVGLELTPSDISYLWEHEYVRELAGMEEEARRLRRLSQVREGKRKERERLLASKRGVL